MRRWMSWALVPVPSPTLYRPFNLLNMFYHRIYIYVYRCIVCLQHLPPCSCSPDHLWHHFCLDKSTVPLKSVGPEAPTCAAYHNIVRMQGLKPTYIHFQATFPNKHHTHRHLIHITLQKLSEPWSQPVVFFSWVAVRQCEYLALTHATQ